VKKDGQEMLITGQIEHKYEKGKAKRGREKEKECIERGNILYRREGSEDRRGQTGRRGANMKRSRRGKNQKKGREKIKEKRVEGAKEWTHSRKKKKGT
jgi:hypothetical protein